MAQYNAAERQAGVMILSNLTMFNQAVVVFENQIGEAFWKGFDQCIDRFLKDNSWGGAPEYEKKEYSWLAPRSWEYEEDDWNCWFETYSTVDDGVDYTLAVLTGNGTEQGHFGFRFRVNTSRFSAPRKYSAFVKSLNASQLEPLQILGCNYLASGELFFPVKLDATDLAECWQEHGSFPDDSDAFSPLRNTLENIVVAVAHFDSLFASCFTDNRQI